MNHHDHETSAAGAPPAPPSTAGVERRPADQRSAPPAPRERGGHPQYLPAPTQTPVGADAPTPHSPGHHDIILGTQRGPLDQDIIKASGGLLAMCRLFVQDGVAERVTLNQIEEYLKALRAMTEALEVMHGTMLHREHLPHRD